MTRTAAQPAVGVTGLGLVTPAGVGVDATWQRVLAGTPTAAHDPALAGLTVDFACRVPDFDPARYLSRRQACQLDRFVHFALVAVREAVASAGLSPTTWDGARVGVVLGNALGGSATFEEQHRAFLVDGPAGISPLTIPVSAISMVAGYVAMDCQAFGPNLVTASACASGATAIGTARQLLRDGSADVVIAGGVESCLGRATVSAFAGMGALSRRRGDPAAASRPFDSDRDGFVFGEGAGILVLERVADARARGATVLAEVAGYGASADGHHATAPHPTGRGARQAITTALADAGLAPAEIDHVNAHGTSTVLNDRTEAAVLRSLFGGRPSVTSVKGALGHLIGAAGAVEAACTVLSITDGVVPPTANLDSVDPSIDVDVVSKVARTAPVLAAVSDSFGFGGQNAVLVLTAA